MRGCGAWKGGNQRWKDSEKDAANVELFKWWFQPPVICKKKHTHSVWKWPSCCRVVVIARPL